MILQSLTKIAHANERVDDGEDDEEDSHNRKRRQGLPNRHITVAGVPVVDPHELEEEVAQSAKVEEDGHDHAKPVLSLRGEGGKEQNTNRDWNRSDCEAELVFRHARDDDEKLDGETEEEEEVELQQRNVNLVEGVRTQHCGAGEAGLTW